MKIIIIGGVAGGASAAARLRRLSEKAEIIILEKGGYISFANCGLPYYIGGTITDRNMLTLQTPESFRARFNIDVRINNEALEIDRANRKVLVRKVLTGETYEESYDRLILSPGAEPIRPKLPGIDSARVFTLRNIPDTIKIKNFIETEKASSAVIIGGGYIGVEMAENLRQQDMKITVVERAEHLLAPFDADMAADIQLYARQKGIKLMLSTSLTGIIDNNGSVTAETDKGNIKADMLIMSVGVRPETDIAKRAGIETNARGSIIVNEHMLTNDENIYAVGDAVEVSDFITGAPAFIPLAGPANRQGRIAADNICGINSSYTGTQGSAILKLFDMTAAATGMNEAVALKAGIDYDKTYISSASHAGYYPGARQMSIKAIWDRKTLRLLGAQIVGFDGIDKRMDVLAAAIRFKAKITDLTALELCYAPPFGSAKDPVNMLGFVAENVSSGRIKQFFWHDVDTLPRDGSITLLDVRTDTERARGHIEGFMHIPVDSLRENLHKLPKDRPVYIHCHSGLRSYIACCMLAGYGYECYNLAGGWRLYEAIKHDKAVPEYICTECN